MVGQGDFDLTGEEHLEGVMLGALLNSPILEGGQFSNIFAIDAFMSIFMVAIFSSLYSVKEQTGLGVC